MAAAALGLLVVTGAGLVLARAAYGWAGLVPWGLTAALVALGGVTTRAIAREATRARLLLATGLLAASVALLGAHAAGLEPLPEDPWGSRVYTAVLALLLTGGALGIVRRWPWARWAVMGLGGAGMLSGVLNLAGGLVDTPGVASALVSASSEPVAPWVASWAWTHLFLTFVSATFLALLGGGAMRAAFAVPQDLPEAVWSTTNGLVATVKLTFVAQLVAATMSVLYVVGQPVVTSMRTSALALACAFVAAALVTLARKTAGVLLLVVTGVGFAGQATATWLAATEPATAVASYYAVFWSLAGVTAVACGAALATTLARAARAGGSLPPPRRPGAP